MVSEHNGYIGVGRPGARWAVVALMIVAIGLSAGGCGSNGGGSAQPTKTSTTEPGLTTTIRRAGTTSTSTSTTASTSGATTTTAVFAPGRGGPIAYAGSVDGQKSAVKVAFTRNAGIENFVVSGLVIVCQPLDNGDSSSRVTRVSIPRAELRADGSIEHTETSAKYRPTLSGTFTPDGSFAGGLFLSGEDDGSVCGGEFTFLAMAG